MATLCECIQLLRKAWCVVQFNSLECVYTASAYVWMAQDQASRTLALILVMIVLFRDPVWLQHAYTTRRKQAVWVFNEVH